MPVPYAHISYPSQYSPSVTQTIYLAGRAVCSALDLSSWDALSTLIAQLAHLAAVSGPAAVLYGFLFGAGRAAPLCLHF